ncbi:hypothetical protein GN244_ATG00529 [Phytophthora infestans]|uniref:Uncharacterized protein n=1 Tax=Phytophthora infestans TaxID=4787 RepID=A0A833TGQ8_PHYIN|nr:hypothetical protein GN244_ATG00529 [Phytophthora infestans]
MPELVGKYTYGEYYKGVDSWFTKNNVDSVKDFFKKYVPEVPECGNTKKNGTPQPLPSDGYVKHDSLGNSHPGPCEVWCDDIRVFHDTNCAGKFAGEVPTKVPIDMKTCKSSSELVFYWLALHVQPWQVYINCVTLDGAGSPGSSSKNSTSKATKAATAPTYSFDKTLDDDSAADQSQPAETPITTNAPETQAPPGTTAPSTSSSKCLRRRMSIGILVGTSPANLPAQLMS